MDRMQKGRIIHCLILVAVICTSTPRVVAITDIRLVDGPSPNEGRLEVSDPAQGWGTVCSTGWDIQDTEVVCRELGFSGANSYVSSNSLFGQSSAPILIKNVACIGNESSLSDCTFDETFTRCVHQQDVGIICHKPGYIGCFGDSFERLFQGAFYNDLVGMTIDACLGFCRDGNFQYAGLEYASECYCADSDTRYDEHGTYDDSECQYVCFGNMLERCGGLGRISVFNTTMGFCDDPGEPEYGTRQGNWFRYGAPVIFDCAEGYNLTGNQSAQCLSVDGSPSVAWNADTPVCLGPTVIPTTIVPSTAGPTTEDAFTTGFFTTKITDASTTTETPTSFTTDGITTTETTTVFTTDETSTAVPTILIDPTTSHIITTTDIQRTTIPNSDTTTEAITTDMAATTQSLETTTEAITTDMAATTQNLETTTEAITTDMAATTQSLETTTEAITTDMAATTQNLETTTDITAIFKTTTGDSITTGVPPNTTEETNSTLEESTGTTDAMTTGPPEGSTQATPTIPSTTEDVTPDAGSQAGRWPWPPVAIGFLLGGIILFLLIVVFIICLAVVSPRAKAKKKEEELVRLRNARLSPAGNSYSPTIVLDRNGRRSFRSNGIQRVEEPETHDNGAFLADDASIIGVYGERQRAVENPYASSQTDDTAKKILFADTARKLNQIYVPGSPNVSTLSRGTRRSSSDRYGAQLVV